MADALTGPMESLSSWWKVAALGTMAAGFAVLILLTVKAYQNAPPIPNKFVLVSSYGFSRFLEEDRHYRGRDSSFVGCVSFRAC